MKKIILQPKITIEFPYMQKSDDYHEFEMIRDQHEDMLSRKILYQELGTTGYYYWAVFYIEENELTVDDVKELLVEDRRTEEQIENWTADLKL